MIGKVHSIETCGTVDGPGLRYIVFMQGCLLRCRYCHNPDTWKLNGGTEYTPSQIVKDAKSYLPFMRASGGGITISGGEPLLQIDFVTEVFRKAKAEGIHTVMDSSGGSFSEDPQFLEKLDQLLEVTDLILLDLKHIRTSEHKALTGMENDHILQFAKYLDAKKVPVWIRYVLVPGVTDNETHLKEMGEFISSLGNVEKVEVLPYHKLGVYKWETLGMPYSLSDVDSPSEESVDKAVELLNRKL